MSHHWVLRYGADGFTLDCVPPGQLTCAGKGGPWAAFLVDRSPADPSLVRLTPAQFAGRVVAVDAQTQLLGTARMEEAGEAAEAWFRIHEAAGLVRLESFALRGQFVATARDGRVMTAPGGGTAFTLRRVQAPQRGSRRQPNPDEGAHAPRAGLRPALGMRPHLAAAAGDGGALSGVGPGVGAAFGLGFGGAGGLLRRAAATFGTPWRGAAQHGTPGGGAAALDPLPLSEEDKLQFRRSGYIVLRGAVDAHLVARALRTIQAAIGATMEAVTMGHAAAPEAVPPAQPDAPEPSRDAAVLAGVANVGAGRSGAPPPLVAACGGHADVVGLCMESRLWPTVAALFGGERRVHRPRTAQVAPRFPHFRRAPPPECAQRWYAAPGGSAGAAERGAAAQATSRRRAGAAGGAAAMGADEAVRAAAAAARDAARRGGEGVGAAGAGQGDAARWHVDGMDRLQHSGFSLLCGIMLSDLPEPDMGNFTVFPGSQDLLAAHMAAHGERWLFSAAAKHCLDMEPVQIVCRAGDVVLAHPLLAHRVGLNYSPHVRHAVFMRLHHADHDRLRARIPSDLWVELPGAQ